MEFFIAALLVIVVSVVGVYKWWQRKLRLYWEKQGVHYFDASLISVLYQISKKPAHEFFLDIYKTHGRIFGAFEFQKPYLSVSEPDLLRDILVKDFQVFNYRRDILGGDEIWNKLITVMKGDDWKRVRSIITPVFTSRRLKQMLHIINEISNTVVCILGKHADEGKPADFKSIFGAFTLDVIAKAAFATKIDSLNNPEHIFVKQVEKIGPFCTPSILRILVLVLLPRWLLRKLKIGILPSTDFFKSIILQVIKERKETGKRYDDMLQLFLDAKEELDKEKSKEAINYDELEDENDQFGSITNSEMTHYMKNKKMSENELIAQCILFLIVGNGTTTSTLSFLAYLLASNPECQQKLTAEIDEVFKKQKELDYDALRRMKYLDCVVSETLRMYPAFVRSERTACEDYKLRDTGITIEKGTIIGFSIHAMHHDPEFFPNPEKFDPERFLSENATHPQYAYLPFGAGPRNCLGMRFALMEIKLCISHILRHYVLKIAHTTKVPLEIRKFTGLIEVNELFLAVERRNV